MRLRSVSTTAGLGAALLAIVVFATVGLYSGFFDDLFRGQGRTIRAEFHSTQQLRVGDEVRLDGREEGRVTKISPAAGGRAAVVQMDVGDGAGPIYDDARAELRWHNLLGGSFYVRIDRGSAGSGELRSGTIPPSRTSTQVELDDITSIFVPRVQQGTKTLLHEGGRALADPDGLANATSTLGHIAPNARDALKALRGSAQEDDLRELVRTASQTVSALDAPGDDLRRLVAGASATLQTTAARDDDLRSALAQGGGTADAIRTTLGRLVPTLENADRLLGKLQPVAARVAPTLRRLRPTLVRTDSVLGTARPLLRSLRPAVSALASASTLGDPLLQALQPSIDRLEKSIIPFLAAKDPETGKSTTVMIGGTAAGFGGAAGQQDRNGHFVRFPASVGLSSVYLPCRTAITDPSQAELLACESLQDALRNYLEYLPPLATSPPEAP